MKASCRVIFLCTALLPAAAPLPAQVPFLRGDPDESGTIAVTDAIRILHFLFLGEGDAVRCRDAADADDDGSVRLGDALHLLNGLFLGGPAPAPPFPRCGPDPTADGLDCAAYEACKPATVQFFGIEFEARAVLFVVDRSGSFNAAFRRSKDEVVATIGSLSEDSELAVFFFDRGLYRWPYDVEAPARATADNKAAAIALVNGLSGGQGTCQQPALLKAIEYATRASVAPRSILFVTDGGSACNEMTDQKYWRETIDKVTAANNGLARIHSVQVVGSDGGFHEDFMKEIAEKNGGTFHRIEL